MRRRNRVFALKKHEGHCSILRSNALFLRDKPVFSVCRLLNRNSKCTKFTQRRTFFILYQQLHICFVFTSYLFHILIKWALTGFPANHSIRTRSTMLCFSKLRKRRYGIRIAKANKIGVQATSGKWVEQKTITRH